MFFFSVNDDICYQIYINLVHIYRSESTILYYEICLFFFASISFLKKNQPVLFLFEKEQDYSRLCYIVDIVIIAK